jgi:curved DNA-binding protein CbpA
MTVPDLYAVLGVDRTASHDDIRRAYRKLAKDAHPDAGGDVARFQGITMAHEVLSDPERRARYDATGKTDEPQDFALGNMLSALTRAFHAAVGEIFQAGKSGGSVDIASFDLDRRMQAWLMKQIAEGRETMKFYPRDIAALENIVLGFKLVDEASGENYIQGLVRAELEVLKQHWEKQKTDIASMTAAIEDLKRYRYVRTPGATTPQSFFSLGYGNFGAQGHMIDPYAQNNLGG